MSIYLVVLSLVLRLATFIRGHSWLHCVDYDPAASLKVGEIQNRYCRAFPRGVPSNAVFGEDRGFNYQPIGGRACRTASNGVASVVVQPGRKYRLLWPAKNHASGKCTNGNIVDRSLRLYAYPVQSFGDPDPNFVTWTQRRFQLVDLKGPGFFGFQNCPDFCPQSDRVPCYGDVPLNFTTPGRYKMIWVWNFNPNEVFTHCFDAVLGSSPTTRVPTLAATRTPTRAPTRAGGGCSNAVYRQCGGQGWTGARCCPPKSTCTVVNAHYSQCVPV